MPLKKIKKIKKSKSNIIRRNLIKFPSEKIVSLHLAKCMKKDDLRSVIASLEICNRKCKRKRRGNDGKKRNHNLKLTDESEIPTTSNCINEENSPPGEKIIKKMKVKKIVKRKHKKFKYLGRLFINSFKYFARSGQKNPSQNAISYLNTLRWLKKAEILDNHRVTMRDVEVHFINHLKRGYELKILEFIQFLKSLSEDRCLQMRIALPKLLNCREKNSIIKKRPLFCNVKRNSVRKSQPARMKNTTCNHYVKKTSKGVPNISTIQLKKCLPRKQPCLVSGIQSSEELSDNYVGYNADNRRLPSRALTVLKSRTSFLNSNEIPSPREISVEWIVTTPKPIPSEDEALVIVTQKSGLLVLDKKTTEHYVNLELKYPKSKRMSESSEKQKHSSINVDLHTKSNSGQKSSQKVVLNGVSLRTNYEESYEFISDSDDELIRPEMSSKQIKYQETSSSNQAHLDSSFDAKKIVGIQKQCSTLKGRKCRVFKSTTSILNNKLQLDSKETKTNFKNTMSGIVSIKNINPKLETGDSFEIKDTPEILKTPKCNTLNMNKRSSSTYANKKGLKSIGNNKGNIFNENVKMKTQRKLTKPETEDKLAPSFCKQFTALPNGSPKSKCRSLKNKNAKLLDIKNASQETKSDPQRKKEVPRDLPVKTVRNFHKDKTLILKVPKYKFSENRSKMAKCTYQVDTKNRTMICTNMTYENSEKETKEYERLGDKNKSILPIDRNMFPDPLESLDDTETNNSVSKTKLNTSAICLKSRSNKGFPEIKTTSQQRKSLKKRRDQRTFTNLPVRQVQKALSKLRKVKQNTASKTNYPKGDSNLKAVRVKFNRNVTPKERVKLNEKCKKGNKKSDKIDVKNDLQNTSMDTDI